MSDQKIVALELALQIVALFKGSGATQVEQLAALQVARALVPVSGASVVMTAGAAPEQCD
jgi:hypothetical protein